MWFSAIKMAMSAGSHIYKKRQEIDQAKLVQNRDINEDKLEQNEELAELRADTSIEKQEMANENRLTLAKMKPKGISK